MKKLSLKEFVPRESLRENLGFVRMNSFEELCSYVYRDS
jgi:hypothetical protein